METLMAKGFESLEDISKGALFNGVGSPKVLQKDKTRSKDG